jgi:tetratricopeptide (TPR) repeat protein
MSRVCIPTLLTLAAFAVAPTSVLAQQDGLPAGVTREQMWYAPTAEDWAKPVQITWQRTWEDALAVAEETGKAILVCVNMDGEIASEHYAGIRYRDPEIGKLYEPYVCVIASVYRHNPSDYDEAGNRVECPRFHGVTCGEHITMEPIVYDRFLDGTRVAPRHIMVELDGSETYDVFYAWDTDSVFRAIREGIENRQRQPNPPRGDRSLLDKVASRDAADRAEVEAAYVDGDASLKAALVQAALDNPQAEQGGLLRLALYDLDENLNKMARVGLSKTNSTGSIDLILEAMRGVMPEAERQALVEALARLGQQDVRARTLANVHNGLGGATSAVDAGTWNAALQGAEYPPPPGSEELEDSIESAENRIGVNPEDPQAQLQVALAALEFAVAPSTAERLARNPASADMYLRAYYQDAIDAARDAERLGASGWQLDAVFAITAWWLGEKDQAYQRAEAAVAALPPGDVSWNGMAVLDIFADGRRRAIADAVTNKKDWPAQWMSDLHASYSVLAQHPLGNVIQVMTHYDFLVALGADRQAGQALRTGMARFPENWDLHARFRDQVLRQRGVAGLEAAYERWLKQEDAPKTLRWFAGYASIQAAETWRKSNSPTAARASYDRALGHYESMMAADPNTATSSQPYVAIALAGRARLKMEAQDLEGALEDLLRSFEVSPLSANVLDGLNLSGYVTSVTLQARLIEAEKPELVAKLIAAVEQLPAEARQRPDYDTPGAPSADASRFGGGPGGQRNR